MRTPQIARWPASLLVSAVVTSFVAIGQPSEPAEPSRPARAALGPAAAPLEPVEEVFPAHFQATVYELQTSVERAGTLDGKALASRAATAETLLQALSDFGKARVLYRIDQPVNVCSESITVGASEPMVAGTRTGPRGQAINTVRYQSFGVVVRLGARLPAPGADTVKPNVRMSVQLSAMAASSTELAPGQKASATRMVHLDHSEPLEFARVLWSRSAHLRKRSRLTRRPT